MRSVLIVCSPMPFSEVKVWIERIAPGPEQSETLRLSNGIYNLT